MILKTDSLLRNMNFPHDEIVIAPSEIQPGHPSGPRRIDARRLRQPLPLWDEAALRAAEARAAAALPAHALMDRAGRAVAALLRARWPHARRVLLLCGPGNNGGDGLRAAAALASLPHAPRLQVLLVGCGEPAQWCAPHRGADWCWALQQARAAGLQPLRWEDSEGAALLADSEVAVDALLGLGLREAPRGALAQAIAALAAAACPVLAVDLPSGLQGGSANAPGALVRASATLAMLGLQPGHATGPHAACCGEIWLTHLEADPAADGALPCALWGGGPEALLALPPLRQAAHKGARVELLLFGGARGMGGALWLAARAGLALGAGRVYAASLDAQAPRLDPQYPEIMLRDGDELLRQAQAADARDVCLVFGPGAGNAPAAADWLRRLLASPHALVIDADGLNLLAAQPRDGALWNALRARARPAWLTPHPSEAARLLGSGTSAVQADRLRAARALSQASGAQVVLKGAGTVIACRDGATWVNSSGNGLLATAGTGDVLSGALGAFLARCDDAGAAARAAVWLHAAAADLAMREDSALRAATLPEAMLRAWAEACRPPSSL